MTEVVEFAAADGVTIYVDSGPEVIKPSGGLQRAGAAERAAQATQRTAAGFEQALKVIKVTAEASFGVRLSAGLNAGVLTSAGAANLNIRVLWRGDQLATPSSAS